MNALFINVGAFGQTTNTNCGVGSGVTWNGGQVSIAAGAISGTVDIGAVATGNNFYNVQNGGMNITSLDGITITKTETVAGWQCGIVPTVI